MPSPSGRAGWSQAVLGARRAHGPLRARPRLPRFRGAPLADPRRVHGPLRGDGGAIGLDGRSLSGGAQGADRRLFLPRIQLCRGRADEPERRPASGPERAQPPARCRIVMSLRAVGEGHISSIAFREGMVTPKRELELMPEPPFATAATWPSPSRAIAGGGPVTVHRHRQDDALRHRDLPGHRGAAPRPRGSAPRPVHAPRRRA